MLKMTLDDAVIEAFLLRASAASADSDQHEAVDQLLTAVAAFPSSKLLQDALVHHTRLIGEVSPKGRSPEQLLDQSHAARSEAGFDASTPAPLDHSLSPPGQSLVTPRFSDTVRFSAGIVERFRSFRTKMQVARIGGVLQTTDLTDKYVIWTRAADAGAIDAGNNWPLPDAKVVSKTERKIIELAQGDLNMLAAVQKQENDEELARIRQLEGSLPFELTHRAEQFMIQAGPKIVEVDRKIGHLYRAVLERERDYRWFRVFHRLNREAAPAPLLFVGLAWLFVAMVADSSLNAYFLKDVGALGQVGGFLNAFVSSACNIALGFTCGWGPARFFGHRRKLHLLWATPFFLALIGFIALFNVGIAHYRDLIVHSPDIEVSGVLDDLYRNAGRIPSFQSCLMAIVGVGVAAFSAVKGYGMLDPYPGYGAIWKRMREAQTQLDEEIADIQERINNEKDSFLKRARETYERANEAAQEALNQYDTLISNNAQFEMNVASIESACRNALETYREHNLQLRDERRSPAPGYFFEKLSLVRNDILDSERVARARDGLKARQTALKVALETLEQDVPELAARLLSEDNLKRRLEEIWKQAEYQDEKGEESREMMLRA